MLALLGNLSIRWKVLLAPAFVILALIGIGTHSLYIQRLNQAAVGALIVGPIQQAETVMDFATTVWTAQTNLYRLTATAANETDQKKIKSLGVQASNALAIVSERLNGLDALKGSGGRVAEKVDKLKLTLPAYLKQTKNVIEMADSDPGAALMFMMGAERTFTEIAKLTDQMIEASKELRDNEIARSNLELDQQNITLTVVMLGAGLGIVLAWIIGRAIARPIIAMVPEFKKLAEGDFNVTLPWAGRKDEVGQIADAAEMVAQRVGATITTIKLSASEVTGASAEISSATTNLSQRTEEQAATLEETSASMEEISATVKKNAENAQQANQFATETQTVAERGGAIVGDAVNAMARIEESSRKISDIIGVIDEIARQTNLLALNAAVEAARAGEAGRGFAVVATEVRGLAQRSSQAAKDIKELITNSSGQVQEGVDLVNRAGTALNEIVESIKKVSAVVSDIANASMEQSSGIEQINKALTQMDEVTQQNSALVEENAATAKTLEQQARAMDERVAAFRLRDLSEKAEARQRPAAAEIEQGAAARAPAPRPAPVAAKRPAVAAPKRVAAGGGPASRTQGRSP